MNPKKTTDFGNVIDSLPWEEIATVAKDKYKTIPLETYQFVLKKENRQMLIDSAMKSLRKTDPENATEERAVELADIMQNFARMALKDLEKKTK